ncbi:MAG: AI-2E family transporter [Cytophagales bacterium]
MNSKLGLSNQEQKKVLLFLLIGISVLLVYAMRNLLHSFMGAIVIYIIFRDVNLWLAHKLKWPKPLSAILVMLMSFLLIVVPIAVLSSMLYSKIGNIWDYEDSFIKLNKQIDIFFSQKLQRPDLLEQLVLKLERFLANLFPTLIDSSLHIFLSIGVMYFVLFFMFTDSKEMEKSVIKNLPIKRRHLVMFGSEAKKMTYSSVLGQGMISFIQMTFLIVGMGIFGYPDPLFWGVIGFFLSFLPALGTPLIFVPWSIAFIINGDNVQGYGLLIWGFVLVSGIDNVLRLWINKKIGNFHPLISILGVIIGIPMFGFLGLVFGPLLFSFFIISVKIFSENKPDSLSLNV